MRRLNILDAAKDDLTGIASAIAESSGSVVVAERFIAKIITKCSRMALLRTLLGRPRPELRPDLRSIPFGNYVIFFRYTDKTLDIVNVLHGARDLPAYFAANDFG